MSFAIKRKVGRPRTGPTQVVPVRMTHEHIAFFDHMAVNVKTVVPPRDIPKISRSWIMLRLMELGQDLFNRLHFNHPITYETTLRKAIEAEKKAQATEKAKGLEEALSLFHDYINSNRDNRCEKES